MNEHGIRMVDSTCVWALKRKTIEEARAECFVPYDVALQLEKQVEELERKLKALTDSRKLD